VLIDVSNKDVFFSCFLSYLFNIIAAVDFVTWILYPSLCYAINKVHLIIAVNLLQSISLYCISRQTSL